MPLSLYTDGTTHYSADSPEDAAALEVEHGGENEPRCWIPLLDAEPLSVLLDFTGHHAGFVPDGAEVVPLPGPVGDFTHRVTATARAWADHVGRGFVCSTEW